MKAAPKGPEFPVPAPVQGKHLQGVHVEALEDVPLTLLLGSAHPNPTSVQTSFRMSLPDAGPVRLRVYDAGGRLVRTLLQGMMDAGTYAVDWDGRDMAGRSVAPGVYFFELRANTERLSKRVTWLP